MSDAELVGDETRLAKDWEREEAVDWSCDCMLIGWLSSDLGTFAFVWGLESVLSRRRTPETAYDIGYVKYEDGRVGVE
jgi:hypothetical protein